MVVKEICLDILSSRLTSIFIGLAHYLRPLVLCVLLFLNGCGYLAARNLEGQETRPPAAFNLVDKAPCYLELEPNSVALRMNCFDLDGVLHIHSSRWSKLPRLSGESWTVTAQRQPNVRVEIEDHIYRMTAVLIDDEEYRQRILYDRAYWYAWEAILVFKFLPTDASASVDA